MTQLECDTQCRYTPDPGEVPVGETVHCGVCGDAMVEKRDCYGPRGFAQAIGGGKSKYDCFNCPNAEEMWHRQVVVLRNKADQSPSAKLANMMRDEANEILTDRVHTKEVYFGY
jgi:hypothetical protein